MTDMVERVTRAILKAHGDLYTDEKSVDMYMSQDMHSGDCTKQPWTCNKCYTDMYRKQARAAILTTLSVLMEKSDGGIPMHSVVNGLLNEIDAALQEDKSDDA